MSEPTSASFTALGTTAAVHVTEASALPAARGLLEEGLAAIDESCSRFRADSELSRVNAAAGRPIGVSRLFMEALEVALRAARVTGGIVVPTVGRAMRAIGYDRDFASIGTGSQPRPASGAVVPGWQAIEADPARGTLRVAEGVELDLGATAKAFAADRAANEIGARLGTGVLVNLGGDIAVAGKPPEGGWVVRVADDHRDVLGAEGETVSITAGGLATSSTTVRSWVAADQQRHHIVDPRRGESATVVWRTATVAAASCVDANTASTAAIVMGDEAPGWLRGIGLPGRLVGTDGEVRRIGHWPQPVG